MKQLQENNVSRRKFMNSIVPMCAAACFLKGNGVAFAQSAAKTTKQPQHKFDQKMKHEFTYSSFYTDRYSELIGVLKALENELGKEKLIAVLKKNTSKKWLKRGQEQAKEIGDNSLAAYVKQFRPPSYQNVLTHEIVEDTDTAFQIKVTECIWAKTFIDAGMEEYGYAHICYGDYSWAKGFNPNMKMERDKTLMQGNDCCNHRYIMKG
jgi:hypothetical protein